MLHIPPTNLLLLAVKQEPYKKAYLLTKNIRRIFWKKFWRMDQQVEKDLTERVLRPGSGGGGGGNNTLNIVHTKILHNHWKVYYVYFIT